MEARKVKMIRWMAVALVASLLSALPAYGQSEGEKALLDKARSLDARGNLDLAAQDWRQVLLSDPNNAEALAGVAKADMVAGRAEEARAYLDRLRSVNPSDPRIEQIETMQKQRAATPQLQRAGKLAESGQYAQAMTIYRQAYGTNPPAGDIALAYYETEAATPDGREHAIAGLRELAQRNPDDPRYEITLGRILTYNPKTRAEGIALLEKHPKDGQANEAVRQALTWDAANPATAGAIRNFLKQHPDKDLEAKLQETESKQFSHSGEFARNAEERAAYAALAQNNLPLAEARFQSLREKQPKNPRMLAGFGFLRMKENNFTAAAEFLQEAEANGGRTAAIRNGLATAQFWMVMQAGTAALEQNQLDAAIAQFRHAAEMRPTSPDAMRGLAGTLLRAQQPGEAERVYAHLVKVQPSLPEGWRGLFTAQYLGGNPQAALATVRHFPAPVRTALAGDPEYLANLAAAYNAVGDVTESQRVLAQAMAIPFPNNGAGLKPATLLQFGDLLMQANRYQQAAGLYRQVIAADPNNASAYQGLVRAQHSLGSDADALTTVESMPPAVLEASERDPNFLTTLASIYQAQGKLDIAQKFIEDALARSTAGGAAPSIGLELQLAGVYAARGNSAGAYGVYQHILSADPGRMDAWKGLISALHSSDRDRDAMAELRQIPPPVFNQLQRDPQFLQVLASVYSGAGDRTAALATIHAAALRYQDAGTQPSAGFAIQYCYMLLNAGDDQGLYLQLMQMGERSDLTPDQRSQVQTIWAVWSVRRAAAASKSGNYHRALQILDAANRAFPENLDVQKALAGGYQQAGQSKRAEDVYLQMDWTNATAMDYHAAIGAALAGKDRKQAQTWLEAALKQYPNDPRILQEAAEFEQARGDNPRATAYYKASLDAMGPEDHAQSLVRDLNDGTTKPGGPVNNPTQELMNALAPLADRAQPATVPMYDGTQAPMPGYLPAPVGAPVPIYTRSVAGVNRNADVRSTVAETTETPVAPTRRRRSHRSQSQSMEGQSQPQQPQQPQNVERLGDYNPQNPPQSSLTPAEGCALNRMAGIACNVGEENTSGWTVRNAVWHASSATQAAQQGDTEIHVPAHARLHRSPLTMPAAAAPVAPATAVADAPAAKPVAPVAKPAQPSTPVPAAPPAPVQTTPIQSAQIATPRPTMHLHLRIPVAAVAAAAVTAPASAPVTASALSPTTMPAPVSAELAPPAKPVTPPPAFLAESVKPAVAQHPLATAELNQTIEEVPGIRYAPTASVETYHKAQYSTPQQQTTSMQGSPSTYEPPALPKSAYQAGPAPRPASSELPPPPPQQQPQQAAQPGEAQPAASPFPAYQAAPPATAAAPYAASPLPGYSSSQPAGAGSPGFGTYSQAAGAPYNPGFGPGYTNYNDTQTPVEQQPYYARRLPALTGPAYAPYQEAMPKPALPTQRDQIQDQLAALQGGYSPWVGGSAMVSYRSGTAGFDRFLILQTPIEGSAVINDSVRATIVARPVLIDSGTPVASSIYGQGTLGVGVTPDTQTASGFGGEVQLRSANYGISAGTTPYGFDVFNIIGSLYARPAAGPFTFTFVRDSITDTQLSYAGLKNTGAAFNNVNFGGVVANAFEGQFATSGDHSGYYLQGGGQYITGTNVKTNARADGDAGAYWRVAQLNDYGSFTLGMNLFAMHYNTNLRYFSFGQGGYFSPDAYILANIPVTFNGHYGRNFHYRINGSLGVQGFQEDSSLYFPTQPSLQQQCTTQINPNIPPPTCMYPTHDSIGGNYLIDAEAAYRVSEHWYAGGFFNANNSRDYNTATVGFFVRYMFRAQFPTEEGPPTGIFPMNGLRPIQVP
jgi:tetratricopeptide (TPR) repeat protein